MKEKNNEAKGNSKKVTFTKLIAEPIPFDDQACSITLEKYDKVGFEFPWVEYEFKNEHGQFVEFGGFMGPPKDGQVEIDFYMTYDPSNDVETLVAIYSELVEMAYQAQENIRVIIRCNPLDLGAPNVLIKCGFLAYHVPDDLLFNNIAWIHKTHLEKFPDPEVLEQVEEAILKYEQSPQKLMQELQPDGHRK